VKVLVSGASGFIGAALCDALLVRGDTVVGLTRDPKRARGTNPSVNWHAWEPTLLGEKINQRWTDEAKQRIMESRRTGTHNLIGTIAGLERKPKVLVNQSAIGYYGDRGEAIVDESAGPGGSFDAEVVQEWEKAAHEVDGTGVRLAIVRTGHVLDPSGGFLKQLLTPFKLGVGGPLAGGDQYVSWVHIDDEVGILLWALDNDKVSGVVNSTAPNPATNKAFSKALGKALGRPAVMPIPGFALDLMYGSEFGVVLKGGQRVMPRRALDLGYEFQHPDLAEALGDLL
jgi:uncharacterized protein (TIGR01777 family)